MLLLLDFHNYAFETPFASSAEPQRHLSVQNKHFEQETELQLLL